MKALSAGIVLILASTVVFGQEGSRFSFGAGAGFTNPVGNAGRNLDYGWNARGSLGYKLSDYVGANLNVGYDSMGINSTTLSNLGVPGGDVHILSATVDPVVHLNPHGHVDFYVTGGGGLFHWYQQFTQPSVAVVPGFNPFFGFFNAAVPATQVLSSYSVNKPGVDIGAGIAFGAIRHGKFFAEARYDHIFMTGSHVDYIPVTFGFRW